MILTSIKYRAYKHFIENLLQRVPQCVDGIIAALVAASVAIYLFMRWPLDIHVPFAMGGDATSAQYIFRSIIDHGSYLQNPEVGAPFGATMHDYPIPEPTHWLLIKLIGVTTSDAFAAFNIFYLLSFITTAFSACWALSQNGIGRLSAIAGAVAFALLPYHFFRIAHIFLASYAAIPVFCHYALQLTTGHIQDARGKPLLSLQSLSLLAIAAGTGVYYAFFGMLFILLGAILGFSSSRNRSLLLTGTCFAAVIVIVVAVSLLPNMLYHFSEGANVLVAQRQLQEAEIFGLKISQMLFPTTGHRISELGRFMTGYNQSAPLVNENMTSALGLIGSIGLIVAITSFFMAHGRPKSKLWAAGALSVAGILYAMIGGFGAIAARLAIPEIRGLNRISVFISFFAIFSFLIMMQKLPWMRYLSVRIASCALFISFAYLDQVPVNAFSRQNISGYATTKALYKRVQDNLAVGTAIYQLPHIFFPESPQPPGSYSLLEPYLFTEGLRWSFGGMRGRASDQWNEQASYLTGETRAQALTAAGYGAVYVDRRGYADKGAAVESDLRASFGAPVMDDPAAGRALYLIKSRTDASAPFIVAGLGKGWSPWSSEGSSDHPTAWSTGSASLIIANPNGKAIPFLVQFKLTTTTPQNVTVFYDRQAVCSVQLKPGQETDLVASIIAQAGISELVLTTDVAPRMLSQNTNKTTFGIRGLTYSTSSLSPSVH